MLKSETDLRNETWKVEKEFGEFHVLKQGSGSLGDRPGFLILVSSFWFQYQITLFSICFLCLEHTREREIFVLQRTRTAADTSGVG